ncbi:MAG TPA: isoprenylcysteine carboxylmethyltransferase family protein [Vicinamibacterales bacterium]|nr:isoprenylcysteine carboxylmethyltransferase family protein [Vicinamibacterales bacterium]
MTRRIAAPHPAAALALAWAGGALFVLSLGYFVYFYLVRLGRPAPAGPVAPAAAFDAALFALFALHHSLLARERAKRWLTRVVPAALERTTYVWTASLLLLVVCRLWRDVPGTIYRLDGAPALLLYTVQAAGAIIAVRASSRLGSLALAGIRQAQELAGHPPPVAALRDDGLYAFVRHPVYLGWFLFVFGTPHMTAGRLLFAVLSAVYILAVLPLEERALAREFGERYQAYARKVRWRLLPGVF